MKDFIKSVRDDISTALQRDPAARSRLEILLCYPGLHAVWVYRFTHQLWQWGLFLPARIVSQCVRLITGVEIHPAAQIGNRLFIDHATGVVIGETAIVGDDVTLYQGVTLGGTGKEKGKRHPTIGNNVVIGAGAKVLGNIAIGDDSRIGAGSVVLQDVPMKSTVVGVPGRVVYRNGIRVLIADPKDISDPLLDLIASLTRQVQQLERQFCLTVKAAGSPEAIPRSSVQDALASKPMNTICTSSTKLAL
jgi:serine O-acetyltransferase